MGKKVYLLGQLFQLNPPRRMWHPAAATSGDSEMHQGTADPTLEAQLNPLRRSQYTSKAFSVMASSQGPLLVAAVPDSTCMQDVRS